MREDMFKVIVERPRWGRKYAARSKARYDKCPDRKHVSGRRLVLEHSGYTKQLNENLAPLKRYLNKQVGRPWNKVYSEISQHLDASSTVKQHVRDHLTDFVLIDVGIDREGGFYAANHWGRPTPPEQWWAKLYVDPKDGLIKRTDKLCRKLGLVSYRDKLRADRKRRAQGAKADTVRWLSDTRVLAKLKGHWFEVNFDHPVRDSLGWRGSGVDVLEVISANQAPPREGYRMISKRQLGKKALARHGLKNNQAAGAVPGTGSFLQHMRPRMRRGGSEGVV